MVKLAELSKRNGLQLFDVTDTHIRTYARYRKSKGQAPCSIAILQRLLALAVGKNERTRVRSCPRQAETSVPQSYVDYLRKERALSELTITRSVYVVEMFLRFRFNGTVDLARICPVDVYKFLHTESTRCPGSPQNIASAMRSFFQYLFYADILQENYAKTIPLVARWSKSSVPKSLPNDSIQEVLKKSDVSTKIGRRDYAILLLLARLGLRAGEVVSLELDSIDWENGCVTVKGKTGIRPRLPLPDDVGRAIVDYMLNGRPITDDRKIFLRDRAPYRGFSTSSAISSLVCRALKRANVVTVRTGAHLFRHSLACEMLRQGSSLGEIGDILGHHSPESTAIYAKVDVKSLISIALPWPGGEQ